MVPLDPFVKWNMLARQITTAMLTFGIVENLTGLWRM